MLLDFFFIQIFFEMHDRTKKKKKIPFKLVYKSSQGEVSRSWLIKRQECILQIL